MTEKVGDEGGPTEVDTFIADIWLPVWQKRLSALMGFELTEEATRALVKEEGRRYAECGLHEDDGDGR